MCDKHSSSRSAMRKSKKNIRNSRSKFFSYDDYSASEKSESSDISDNLSPKSPSDSVKDDENKIKLDDEFVIEVNKGKIKHISRDKKELCKVMKFSMNWSAKDIITVTSELKTNEYPRLFVFIIELSNKNKMTNVDKIKNNLLIFGQTRPLVLQILSGVKKSIEYYYKEENSLFYSINLQNTNFKKHKNFPTFLCSMFEGKFNDIEKDVIDLLPDVQNSTIILRFLKVLKLNEEFFNRCVMKISKRGKKAELLAVLDASFEDNGRRLNDTAKRCLTREFSCNPSDQQEVENSSEGSGNDLSILFLAVESENREIIDYLITYGSHLMQLLSFHHQVAISTIAFDMHQYDVLCDLLEISDFPFPENFNVHDEAINHVRLKKISSSRQDFFYNIKDENSLKMEDYINKNSNLKIVYGPSNITAMMHAVDLNKFKAYHYLKSRGFRATEFDNLEDIFDDKLMEEANKYATIQRRLNVDYALRDQKKSISLLCTRSFIHNRSITKELEAKYRKKICKWYEDINMIEFGPEFLKAAASCDNLELVFDFESDTVENVSMAGPQSLGSLYPVSKWIFVGAKLNDKKREQEIKGVLAHELCHYVMKLLYENNENPYFRHLTNIAEKFEKIVKNINKWTDESVDSDDECDGIISSVFTSYKSENFHQELIVRVVQILVQFDDNKQKSKHLKHVYKALFDFWSVLVIPDLQEFDLKSRKLARKINKSFKILNEIKNNDFDFSSSKNIKSLLKNEIVIVTTDFPQLLLKNIYFYLYCEFGNLYDTKNIFADAQKLSKMEIQSDLLKLLQQYQEINIFIDCSTVVPSNMKFLNVNQSLNLTFIVSSSEKEQEIINNLARHKMEPTGIRMLYNWSDLSDSYQKILLNRKINFQGNEKHSLFEILKPSQDLREDKDISDIIDKSVLRLLIENSKISINAKYECKNDEEHQLHKMLFQPRQFYRNEKFFSGQIEILTENEFLEDIKNEQYVLISDHAGNGKSWIMKNFVNVLIQQNPTNWMTYIDLKQHLEDFRRNENMTDFLTFMKNIILKENYRIELKFFKKLYKIGKVFIIFDGFDEISPNFTKFVVELAKSFDYNKGNQLCIATRDYYKDVLQKALGIRLSYKLKEFTLKDGANLVARSWIYKDANHNHKFQSRQEFDDYVNNLEDFNNIQQQAIYIIKKSSVSWHCSIKSPQLFNMVADCFICKEIILNRMQIYDKFSQRLYNRWTGKKGELRNETNVKTLRNENGFWKLHQYLAIKILFPNVVMTTFPDFNTRMWSDEDIIGGGLMLKEGENFVFIHKIFCYYFAAYFIVQNLPKIYDNQSQSMIHIFGKMFGKKFFEDLFLDMFVEILTNKNFLIMLSFVNDAIDDEILEKITKNMQKRLTDLYEMDNFREMFDENLEYIANFVMKILENGNYKKVKKMLFKDVGAIVSNIKIPELFENFQIFLINFLKVNDLKDVIIQNQIFQKIIASNIDINYFIKFVNEVKAKTDHDFIRKGLSIRFGKNWNGNIFYFLYFCSNLSQLKVRLFFEFMQIYFSNSEMLELVQNCNENCDSIFKKMLNEKNVKSNKFQFIWMEMKSIFDHRMFTKIVKQRDSNGQNILHWAATCDQLEFHITFWRLLLGLFNIRKELKELIHADKYMFFHYLVQKNKNIDILVHTFEIFRDDFQFYEILMQKDDLGMRLIQTATCCTNDIRFYQYIWIYFRDLFNSNKSFLEIIQEQNLDKENIFSLAAKYSTHDILHFIITELEQIADREIIRKILSNKRKGEVNLLQIAAKCNKSVQFHDLLWRIINKYFAGWEILEFIKQNDSSEDNLFYTVVSFNKKEVIELTWNKISYFMDRSDQIRFLSLTRKRKQTFLETLKLNSNLEVVKWLRDYMARFRIKLDFENEVDF